MAKFPIQRHTRFAYVARIGPCPHLSLGWRRYGRTSSDIGWFLLGVPAPLPGRSLRTDLARFLASSNDTFGQTKIVIHLSPVTDAIGRIRRCQRSTCVTATLPMPRRGKKNQYTRDFPSNSWNDSTNSGGASMAATAKTRAANPRRSSAYIRSEQMHVHQTYRHATGRRMTLPCVPTGISSGSWQRAGKSRGMFL